jgi:endonuclease-3 related protein
VLRSEFLFHYNPIVLNEMYARLDRFYGPLKWWPAETPFEVIIGAILTQNTAWTNVEKAIGALKREGLMTVAGLSRLPETQLAAFIRPSGYYNQKARKIKAFLAFLDSCYNGSLSRMARIDAAILRGQLLAIHGIGPETADCILLYAMNKPVFVVDAYTRRVLARHGLCPADISYERLQQRIESKVSRDVRMYNQFHALLVQVGKDFCRKAPRCAGCPLEPLPR